MKTKEESNKKINEKKFYLYMVILLSFIAIVFGLYSLYKVGETTTTKCEDLKKCNNQFCELYEMIYKSKKICYDGEATNFEKICIYLVLSIFLIVMMIFFIETIKLLIKNKNGNKNRR